MDWQGLPVLVTGGASFIGSHLVDALVDSGAKVAVVDDLSSGRLENLRAHLEANRIQFQEGDLRRQDAVEAAVDVLLRSLDRADIAAESWRANGAIIRVAAIDEAPGICDRLAPEHLELAIDDANGFADRVRHAGAIFLGRHTPEAIGDYVAGPNHVLPTARSARFASGLSVLDFVKRTSIVRCDAASLAAIGGDAVRLAEAEGLGAHALSVSIRLNR